jgi:hypothetical protein
MNNRVFNDRMFVNRSRLFRRITNDQTSAKIAFDVGSLSSLDENNWRQYLLFSKCMQACPIIR